MRGLDLKPGELDQRITFREKTILADGGGGQETTWWDIDSNPTVWAKVVPMRGDDRLAAAQIEARRDYRVFIRNRSDITDEMAIIWRGKILGVRFIADAGSREQYLMLECEMGAASEAGADD